MEAGTEVTTADQVVLWGMGTCVVIGVGIAVLAALDIMVVRMPWGRK
jgi:hypothetical protein